MGDGGQATLVPAVEATGHTRPSRRRLAARAGRAGARDPRGPSALTFAVPLRAQQAPPDARAEGREEDGPGEEEAEGPVHGRAAA